MTNQQRLHALAQALAAANPDNAEALAQLLGPAARSAKVGGLGLGIAVRFGPGGGREVRGGDLGRYVAGEPSGSGYEGVKG